MYERESNFLHSYGCVFQDCIIKSPKRAIERMHPIILMGTMLGYLHKCALAYVLGHFAHLQKSWMQLILLVCPVRASFEFAREHSTAASCPDVETMSFACVFWSTLPSVVRKKGHTLVIRTQLCFILHIMLHSL